LTVPRHFEGIVKKVGSSSSQTRENYPRDRMATTAAATDTLAMVSADCYCPPMLFRNFRRMPALLATLVLAVGLVAHGFSRPDIIVKLTTTTQSDMPSSGDMPMAGKCNGCAGDEKGLAPAACSAFCGAVFVVPTTAVVLYAVPVETLRPASGEDPIGRTDPPDPYPPKRAILS
jgi:hypothetical protein